MSSSCSDSRDGVDKSRGIFVRSVHSSIHKASKLRSFFSQFGEVVYVKIRKNGNANVSFHTEGAAQLALNQYKLTPHVFTIEGWPLQIEESRFFTQHRGFQSLYSTLGIDDRGNKQAKMVKAAGALEARAVAATSRDALDDCNALRALLVSRMAKEGLAADGARRGGALAAAAAPVSLVAAQMFEAVLAKLDHALAEASKRVVAAEAAEAFFHLSTYPQSGGELEAAGGST